MTEREKLVAWMSKKGYNHSQLAAELGFSYDYIYKIAKRGDRTILGNFKFKFLERFGWEEANQVFDALPVPAAEIA